MKKLMWGLLAAGNISKAFARGVQHSQLGELAAVGSRRLETAKAMAAEFQIPAAHGSYDELLADPNVDAVYISTPHPHHAEWIIKAAEAGKHILCEKPLTMNHAEAMASAEAARSNDVLLMEAFMVRCHPFIGILRGLIEENRIGEIRLIRSIFSFQTKYAPGSRLFNNALGGGGILDVGCYTSTLTRLIAGMATGQPFASPESVSGAATLLETGVDGWAVATLKFPGGILGQLSTGVQLNQDNGITIHGAEGSIRIPNCWIPAKEGGKISLWVKAQGLDEYEVPVETDQWLYGLEADAFARAVFDGKRSVPEVPIEDTLDNMLTLDRWRSAVGLVYDSENTSNHFPTLTGRALTKHRGAAMTYARIPGLDTDISRLVMGCDNQQTMPHASAVFDDYFSRGGNAFDTAFIYGNGRQERLLGHWIQSRDIREQIFVIGKGGHTPFCEPEFIVQQLEETLNRLQSEYVDLYLMHRDNPDIPAGELVDALNGLVQQGKIRAFGGSNWSIARTVEANAYAKANGLIGFAALSNNFSLARMIDPVWGGCVTASDKESRAWLQETGTALFAWSSQARGFFTPRAGEDKLSDPELVRCWYSPDNFQRRQRAIELAAKKHTTPINIALAYVLHQTFPTFALIGPRTIAETQSSFTGLEVTLTPQEIAWLNLEESPMRN
jgi:predicted dehydrogenase/aryl-alcohol dehydrogenase-like predicted oxidoreductase